MAIILTDDGTLDTVLRCEECGEEMRYNYDGCPEDHPQEDECAHYQSFVEWAIEDATEEHECPGRTPNHGNAHRIDLTEGNRNRRMAHTHVFRLARPNGTVELCECGKWRHSANAEPAIVAIELDAFTRAYLECALWTSDPDPRSGEWMEHDRWTIAHIHPDHLRAAIEECRAFQTDNRADLDEVSDTYHVDDERHGHDFWLTRNRHGAGFWDRGYGALGRKLTDAAHAYGSLNVFGPETDDSGNVTDDALAAWDGIIYIE